jgi:hypothetical protein
MYICPGRIIVPTDVGSHTKDYSFNPYILPRRMIVLDDFPFIGRMSIHQQFVMPGPFSSWGMSFHQHTKYPYSWQSSLTLVIVSMEIRTMSIIRTQLCLSIVVHKYYPVVYNHTY